MTQSTLSTPRLGTAYRALVIGATGAIGSAFVHAFAADPDCALVRGLSRQSQPPLRLEDEASMAAAAQQLAAYGPFHCIVDATGALVIDGIGPEKSLAALDAEQLLRNFHVNAVGPALLIKHFSKLLDGSRRSVYAKLSARVGSIGDNAKGGWYGYRSAKAALNMLLQSAAIEIARTKPLAVVVALQPGTVASTLTAPFVKPADCLTPAASVQGMLGALAALEPLGKAHFVDYRGQPIPW
jgi:NAD(P)-dependent dehydrogenase (short-subunit alcohol dehydrogenase family)